MKIHEISLQIIENNYMLETRIILSDGRKYVNLLRWGGCSMISDFCRKHIFLKYQAKHMPHVLRHESRNKEQSIAN